jgi:hypothetical protein
MNIVFSLYIYIYIFIHVVLSSPEVLKQTERHFNGDHKTHKSKTYTSALDCFTLFEHVFTYLKD